MVIAKALDDWRKRRLEARLQAGLEAGRKAGLEEGEAKGRAEERRAWEGWYARWKEAKARGKDFSEPPPSP